MEKAKAFGKSLLKRAAGGSDLSDDEDERRSRQIRQSYCEVVSGSPGRRSRSPGRRVDKGERRQVWGKTRVNDGGDGHGSRGDSSGMMRSPQRLFSAEDVAKLIELARNQLRKEKATESGWTQVESKENKRLEKKYAQRLVNEHQRSLESEPRCWQCNRSDHISSSCPRGERCFTCNSSGHKRADCPLKRRATAAEKGKGKMIVEDDWEKRRIRSGGPLIINEQREVVYEGQENKPQRTENTNVGGLPARQPVRGDSKLPARGEKPIFVDRKSQLEKKTVPYLKNKPVFLGKSEGAMRELTALRATGGVVTKANGNPSIKDYVEALKNMCSTYKDWNWKPIPIEHGVLFQFPTFHHLEAWSCSRKDRLSPAKTDILPSSDGRKTKELKNITFRSEWLCLPSTYRRS